jgi:iron complex outermembrane receptor protein
MRQFLYAIAGLFPLIALAQPADSSYYQLQKIEIRAISSHAALRSLSGQQFIDRATLDRHPSYSAVSALNMVSGVRMEERSPGSYRLSMRGSLLRSPFGVRNIRIYLGDLPFTDAGGNTYLNSLDLSNAQSLNVLKGPEASIYGANTGGVLLIDPVYKSTDSLTARALISGGSYGLVQQNLLFAKTWKKVSFTFNQGFQQSAGYRENSALQRHYFQTSLQWKYHRHTQLKFFMLYSALDYQTPGGLTAQQLENDPRAARPASAFAPGAVTQQAGIRNNTLFGGLTHDWFITDRLKYVVSVFTTHTQFENPFLTNFEQRREFSLGTRTYLDYTLNKTADLPMKLSLGGEWQRTDARIENYGNAAGKKDTMQTADQVNVRQAFLFARFLIDIRQHVLLEASASYNLFTYDYRNLHPNSETAFHHQNFNPQLMPKLAASWTLNDWLAWRASVSAGYSAPTVAEVRASDQVVNTSLQAESGYNYETGFRFRDPKDICRIDVTAFYFELQHAIVRRFNEDGSEYFVNAGGTKQPGLEAQTKLRLIRPRQQGLIRTLEVSGNVTYYPFTFGAYQLGAADFSGHALTGVPKYTSAASIHVLFPARISLSAQYYYAAAIPLNDATTVFAKAYHLVQLKASWKKQVRKVELELFGGVDNLLNQAYSPGNDLNAAGGRYFNAAAGINYYAGLKVGFGASE